MAYSFEKIQAEVIIRKAFELISTPLATLTAEQYCSAKDGINLILTSWYNENVNLWKLVNYPVTLKKGVIVYALPSHIKKIYQCFLRSSTRIFTPTGAAIGNVPNPQNAFDGDDTTFCTLRNANDYVGYNFGVPVNVLQIGEKFSNVVASFDFDIEGSNDGANWTKILSKTKNTAAIGETYWQDTYSGFVTYSQCRFILKNNVNVNLNELFFQNNISDYQMGNEISKYEYNSIVKKYQIGRPTMYYVDYQIDNTYLYIWQAPNDQFGLLYCYAQQIPQTLERYTDSIDIPNTFFSALVYGLAAQLAQQYSPDKFDMLNANYIELKQNAILNNNTSVPLNMVVYG
jgi:hypothetical protein